MCHSHKRVQDDGFDRAMTSMHKVYNVDLHHNAKVCEPNLHAWHDLSCVRTICVWTWCQSSTAYGEKSSSNALCLQCLEIFCGDTNFWFNIFSFLGGLALTLTVPEKLQVYGLYVYYVVYFCNFGMLRVNNAKVITEQAWLTSFNEIYWKVVCLKRYPVCWWCNAIQSGRLFLISSSLNMLAQWGKRGKNAHRQYIVLSPLFTKLNIGVFWWLTDSKQCFVTFFIF